MSGDHQDFGGLHEDLRLTGVSLGRRDILRLALGAGVLQVLGCGGDITGTTSGANNGSSSNGNNATCSTIPSETAGPYPGDGSNGPNVLGLSGVVRQDIRSSFGGLSGTAAGVPLTVNLTLVSTAASCAALAGRAIYLWHCDRGGLYSLYSAGATNQNYLRGVQVTDDAGKVSFTSIFPGCYAGRWPHIHFEIYPSLTAATAQSNVTKISQLAFPKAACDAVYATSGYQASITNLAGVSLATDNVFSDGATLQLATMTGDATAGYTAALQVSI
ncbi:MAG: intradiol ring-cleavage dioxygenase [Gemmatimonadaceae bacterium]